MKKLIILLLIIAGQNVQPSNYSKPLKGSFTKKPLKLNIEEIIKSKSEKKAALDRLKEIALQKEKAKKINERIKDHLKKAERRQNYIAQMRSAKASKLQWIKSEAGLEWEKQLELEWRKREEERQRIESRRKNIIFDEYLCKVEKICSRIDIKRSKEEAHVVLVWAIKQLPQLNLKLPKESQAEFDRAIPKERQKAFECAISKEHKETIDNIIEGIKRNHP